MTWLEQLADELARRREQHLFRSITPVEQISGPEIQWKGRVLLNFCHNDYLGLAHEPAVIDAACRAAREWGTGSSASRLITGSSRLARDLEQDIADFKRADAALLFPTGYQASLGVLGTLATRDDIIWLDRLAHACLVEGARLSGARIRVFPHNDTGRLAELLNKEPASGRHWIVADGVTSMDGDIAPMPALLQIAHEHDAVLVIDDAHGTGVVGATGRGTAEHHGITPRDHPAHLVTISTLSKALGAQGGVVTAAPVVRDALVNCARSQIYTTGLAPASIAAAHAALTLLRQEPSRVQSLQQRAQSTREALTTAGLDTMTSETAIIPIRMPDEATALGTSRRLEEEGLLVLAIRPPTVPKGTSRLRVTVNMLIDGARHAHAVETLLRILAR
jgi:8-amino-7-oxononanoate synthase